MPTLSICIPAYNEEKNLPLLLRSIQGQTFTDYEVIVANSEKTTDRTAEFAESLGARVVVGSPSPGAGRNNAAAHAKGEVLLFLDADVVLPDPWFLQMTIGEFQKMGLGVATCKLEPLSDRLMDKVGHQIFNYFMVMTRDISPHAPGFCIFARKSIHDKMGGFDEEITLAEDHDYVKRGSKYGKFGVLKSYKIPVSVRRLDRDGRLNVAMKYMLAELYLQTKGRITSDVFNYTFGHDEEPEEEMKKLSPESRRKLSEQLEQIAAAAKERAKKLRELRSSEADEEEK